MTSMTLTIELPDEATADRIRAAADASGKDINTFATALILRAVGTEEPTETVDMALIAELQAADEETSRTGTVAFDEVLRQTDDNPGFVERLRAQLAAEGVNDARIGHLIGAVEEAAV